MLALHICQDMIIIVAYFTIELIITKIHFICGSNGFFIFCSTESLTVQTGPVVGVHVALLLAISASTVASLIKAGGKDM